MKFQLMKSVALAGAVALSMPVFAQSGSASMAQEAQLSQNGSFSINLRGQKVSQKQLENALSGMLGLGKQITFKVLKKNVNNLGMTHISYQQYFKGIPVQDGMILMHVQDGLVASVNGVVLNIPDDFSLATDPLTANQALGHAQKVMSVSTLMREYPAQLVLLSRNNNGQSSIIEAWRVRIDGRNQKGLLMMNRVFVDATTGALINTYPLINESDVTANAETIYRGTRQITADSFQGGYRLRDNARKIYTYNAGGVSPTNGFSQDPFEVDVDYINHNLDWGLVKTLNTFSVDTLASANFLSGVGQSSVLVTAVGHGIASTIDDADLVAMSYSFSTTMPIVAEGLQVQVEDDSLFGAIANIDFNSGDALDSLSFLMPDTTLGVHAWSDAVGNAGTYTMEMAKNPALDAHWGMEQTHDFYTHVFNRNSYDNQGSQVRNYVNGTMMMLGTQTNAAALPAPYNSMVYGMGDGVSMGPVVGLDVMGHEFSHMVTANNGHGGLDYQDESGALNESFSDMMGTAIEFYADSADADWYIGDGVMLQSPYYMRSMAKPNGPSIVSNDFTRQPDTYLGTYWYSGQQDNGGVHINSGVPNKWFYLVSEGGSGSNDNHYNYHVVGQGIKKAEQIAYLTLTQYLTPSSTFKDTYYASLEAATQMYGANSPEYTAVQNAWWAVGVPNNDDTTTGINSVASSSQYVSIYPNPATTRVTVASSWQQPIDMVIYSITGAKVRSITIKSGQETIDISNLSKGTYFMKYEINHQLFAEKLTVI